MPRVEIATQAWGWVADHNGNAQSNKPVEINTLDNATASVYTAITAGTLMDPVLTTNTNGEVPGFIEAGSYRATINGVTKTVEAVSGSGGGIPGPPGDPGPSSYDLWLAQGNTGTIDDYLATLVGPPGPPGDPGDPGADADPAALVPLVGRSGTTPFSDGVVITDGSTEAATHKFSLSPRTSTALTFPAVSARATTPNKQTALDVMPNGTATPGTNGYAWVDVCDIDVLDAAAGLVNTARMTAQSDHVAFESYSTGGATPKPMWLRVPTNGTSGRSTAVKITPATGGVAAADDYTITTGTSIILAADGRSVVAGSGYRLKAAADVGFFYIPTIAGAPTGVPSNYGKTAAMAFDPATNRLWIYNNTGTPAWKSVQLGGPNALVQTARVDVGAMTASTTIDVAVTWPNPFPNTNYIVVATPEENISTVANGAVTRQIRTKTTTGCTVRISTGTQAFTAGQLFLDCIGVDPSGGVGGPGWVQMTQADYDALAVKDPNTLYVIVG